MEAQITHIDPVHIELSEDGKKYMELDMLEAIRDLPYREGIWLDVGAHVGNHTVYFAKHCKADRVWAFEPNPDAYEALKINIEGNDCKKASFFNFAVGKANGKCGLDKGHRPALNKIDTSKTGIRIIRLDDSLPKIALIKIDVEGMEFDVLAGAGEVIARDKPELFIETFDDPQKILDLLPTGYKLIKRYNNAPTYHFSANA